MPRRPTDELLSQRLDQAVKDIERIKALVPLVREHSRRNNGAPTASMETRPPFVTVTYEPAPEPLDKQALLELLDQLNRWEALMRKFAGRLPALLPDVTKAESSGCIVCGDSEKRLKRGMCPADYQAFLRAGFPDATEWILKRRNELAQKAA